MSAPTLEQSQQEANAAIGQVAAGSDEQWNAEVDKFIEYTAHTTEEFTSDVIMQYVVDVLTPRGITTNDVRALGPRMIAAKKRGWIMATDRYSPSLRRHVTPIRVWKSCIYDPFFAIDQSL